MLVYNLTHLIFWPVFRFLYGLTVQGGHHIPHTGGMVLAVNHASFLDPPVVGCAMGHRVVYFMAREDLFRIPLLGWYMRQAHALPIRRGGFSRTTLKWFEQLLKDSGYALMVFPEGTRTADGTLGKPRRGIGAICRAAQVPIIPALVQGTYEAWPRWRRLPKLFGKIEVRFGPPVQWSDDELNATGDPSGALARLIMKRIAELHTTHETPLGFWKGYKQVLRRLVGKDQKQGMHVSSRRDVGAA